MSQSHRRLTRPIRDQGEAEIQSVHVNGAGLGRRRDRPKPGAVTEALEAQVAARASSLKERRCIDVIFAVRRSQWGRLHASSAGRRCGQNTTQCQRFNQRMSRTLACTTMTMNRRRAGLYRRPQAARRPLKAAQRFPRWTGTRHYPNRSGHGGQSRLSWRRGR